MFNRAKVAEVPKNSEDFFVTDKPRQWQNYVVEMGSWRPNRDFYRIDGSTSLDARSEIVKVFNDELSNARLLLVSTKAGGIGLNLVGANRAVIMDVNWNPANDVQALCRIYRLGQKKEVSLVVFTSLIGTSELPYWPLIFTLAKLSTLFCATGKTVERMIIEM